MLRREPYEEVSVFVQCDTMMDGLAMIPTLVDAVKVGPGDDFFAFFFCCPFPEEYTYNGGFTNF